MEHFLDKNYPDLAGSKPVIRAVEKAREAGEKPHSRDELIETYIKRLGTITENPRALSLLKQQVISEYVTQKDEIPENFWKWRKKYFEEHEAGEGLDTENEEEWNKQKEIISEDLIADQTDSLSEWFNYLTSSNTKNTPNEIKYWIFRNITKLQEFDKEKEAFTRRSKGTVRRFPELNEEALTYVIESVEKKHQGEKPEFEYDISEEDRNDFKRFLEDEDFSALYSWANTVMNPIPERLLAITKGEWVKFEKGSDPMEIVKTLKNKGTGWCTVGVNTAKEQIDGGDLYIYFTEDDEQKPSIPRIAILKEGNHIKEIRGIAKKQNLDPYITEILVEKLAEFPDKKKYLEKAENMEKLKDLVDKKNTGEDFTKEDLEFLYEKTKKIQNFGEYEDSRIREIKDTRDTVSDYCIIYDCEPEQIIEDLSALSENTVVLRGNLTEKDAEILNNRKNPLVIDGTVDFSKSTSLKSIPEVTIFNGKSNFDECEMIEEIPRNIIFNDEAIFDTCSSLSKISEGVIFNKDTFFNDCTSLAQIDGTVEFNGNAFFSGCTSLKEIKQNSKFKGLVYFNRCTSLEKIPENTTWEEDVNFFGCKNLKEIPVNSVFRNTAYFNNCTSLSKIAETTVFASDVDFDGCESLQEIPDMVFEKAGGVINLPIHLKETYSHYTNVTFAE